ncbi:MAG: M67 family metallopeptidase [Clostridiales Family XIII bacterium]|jgi:proteasome lid subunit RPN8/RPN11|nr:M67 family metallopeptidase [Clostridiales Family XIII bacterium]
MITFAAGAADAIRAEGEKTYPHECCGAILGRVTDPGISGGFGLREAEAVVPVENAREPEAQYHRFVIEADDVMRVELAARRQGLDVLGFYHSHPDHPARPSEYDHEHALPFYSYVIVAVEKGRAAALTSWRLTADRSGFIEEETEARG